MKQVFKLWNTLLLAALLPFALQSCGGGNTNATHDDSVDSAKDVNAATAPVDNESSTFAVKAADIGMTEVKLGDLAQQNASSPRVKAFGQMMVQDHSKAGEELKGLAGAKSVTLPDSVGEDHSKHIQDLSKKKGKDFDKAYIDMMVNGHQDAIDMFDKASKDLKDADLKAFATNTLPTLRAHLDSAKAVQESLKKK
jgi:putative membrane protein